MARKKIITITSADQERLEDLFRGDFADTFRDKAYLNRLRDELDRSFAGLEV